MSWYWHVFQNIGLPGAMAADYVHALQGQPSNMTEQIMGQDRAATFLGNAFREITLIGAGAKIPALGKTLAGWQWSRSMINLVCSPRSPEQYPGAVLDTVVLVLVLKGGPTSLNVPRVHWSEMINSGGAASLGAVVDSYLIHLNTQALAGAVAGARSGGLTVLLAQDGSSGSGNGGGGSDLPSDIVSFKGIEGASAERIRSMVPKDWKIQFAPYEITQEGPYKGYMVQQWKMTSPDGMQELRIHEADPRYGGTGYQARWGVRYPESGKFGGLVGKNPNDETETWLYFDNAGNPAYFRTEAVHIPVSASFDDLVRVFGQP